MMRLCLNLLPPNEPASEVGPGDQPIIEMWMLASDLERRWTLAEIAAEVRGSPIYLTQVFQQVGGLPPISLSVATPARAGTGPHWL